MLSGVLIVVAGTVATGAIDGGGFGRAESPTSVPAVVEGATTSRSTPTADPGAAPAAEPAAARQLTVIATGGADPGLPGDAAARLAPMRPFIAGFDLAICQLTGPASDGFAAALAATGYDRCAVASPRAFTGGLDSIVSSISALDAHRLGHSGIASDAVSSVPSVIEVNGIRVAHLSYTSGFDGPPPGAAVQSAVAVAAPETVIADALAARAAGAQAVMVSIDWGGSSGPAATASDRLRASATIAASGAVDLILGSGGHAVAPIQQIHGVWVAEDLGDSLAASGSVDGIALVCSIQSDTLGRITVQRPVAIPTHQSRGELGAVWPVWSTLASRRTGSAAGGAPSGPVPPATADLAASLARTRQVVGSFIPAGDPS